jgi:type IV secretory pathway VirB9-like protein
MKRLLPLLVGTMLATPALALDQCRPSDTDEQMRVCVYRPLQRYAVNALVGFPVNLQFGADEHIKRFEPGYTGVDDKGNPTQTWRGPASKPGEQVPIDKFKNNLPIWAFAEGRSSLVVVTTTTDGAERSYLFDLNARKAASECAADTAPGCSADPTITAGLSFTYPVEVAAAVVKQNAEQHQAAVAAWMAKQAKAKEDAAIARLKTDALYGSLNKSYQAKADTQFKMLQPSKVWDNGWLTTFVWPHNVQVPSITMIDPATHDERVAPTSPSGLASQDGQIVVINGTSEWFRLRLGPKAVMDVHNLNWSPNRPDPGTGTTSPDAIRTVIQAKQ